MSINSWPILSFIPTEIADDVIKAFVFGGAGNEAIIVVSNGDVYALGFNGNGCLGIGNGNSTLEPRRIDILCQKELIDFAYGMGPHVLTVTATGELYSWGHGGYGQLGHVKDEKSKPVLVPLQKKVIQIACGSYHSVALTSEGEIYAWGSNNCGQLGLSMGTNQQTPKRVNGHLTAYNKKVVSLSCGQSFTIVLTDTGELFSWGYNGNGQLGIGNNTNQQQPAKVTGLNGKQIQKVVCGMAHVLALTDTGELYSWGANSYGQLGLGTTLNTSTPTIVPVMLGDRWTDIAAHHYNHISAAVLLSGKICMWGQCHGLTLLSPRQVAITSLDAVFACFGMPQIMFRFTEIDHDQPQSLKDTIKKSFDDSESSDLTFVVGGKNIHVHKSILKIRCSYFRSMLQTHWQESNKSEIEVTQFSYEVYKSFLQYLYTDQVDISPENNIGLLDLADSYCEARLKKICENLIKKSVAVENVSSLLAAAVKYNATDLEEFCFRFSLNHLTAVTQTEAFKQLDGETIKEFVIKAGANGAFKR